MRDGIGSVAGSMQTWMDADIHGRLHCLLDSVVTHTDTTPLSWWPALAQLHVYRPAIYMHASAGATRHWRRHVDWHGRFLALRASERAKLQAFRGRIFSLLFSCYKARLLPGATSPNHALGVGVPACHFVPGSSLLARPHMVSNSKNLQRFGANTCSEAL